MNLTKLPHNLPRPIDDGSCDHLLGMTIPNTTLPSTKENFLNICEIDTQFVIMYFFPMIGILGKKIPIGWNNIPGARGCTPQNITINEHIDNLRNYGAIPIGISTQPINELSKISSIRGFSQKILSDNNLEFQQKLGIPTFQVEDKTMYKRVTLILENSKIIKVFYPVFPSDKHIFEILEWLKFCSIK